VSILRAGACFTFILMSLLAGCHAAPKAETPGNAVAVPILLYHHIADAPRGDGRESAAYTVSPKSFNAQMEWLHKHGYHAITPQKVSEALRGGKPLPAKPVLISLDDGWIDQYALGFPILQRHGLTATFFVYPSGIALDKSDGVYMTWPQLLNLIRQGMDIQSHSISHPDLTTLSPQEAHREILESKAILESHLNRPVIAFAYPFGKYNDSVIAIVKAAGYRCALGTEAGTTQAPANLYSLKRIQITYGDTLDDFVRKVAPGGVPISK
jgi:peptidoglycan/xylan/chitin deacetylase (PgdA/CDA1 family)